MHELGTVLGVFGHPDDETYLMAGLMAHTRDEGNRVVCVTATQEWVDEFVPRMNKFHVFAPGFPPVTSPDEPGAIQFVLPLDTLERKLQAIECHVSQVEYMLKYFGEDFFREAHKGEYFR